ncbi:MAG TPA: hypothetical protein VKE22_20925 [Haliangiales bacterium]|nr:hypothetical protein [Haliangiales bacterium]
MANVIFTLFLYVSPVHTIPSWDHTGVPHFHSSTMSGSAALIVARTQPSVSPRQSSRSAIRRLMSSDAGSPCCVAPERFIVVMIR